MNRREFLKLSLAASLLSACDIFKVRGKIGLALGGGGAKGLAHIPMLEVLDELKIRPHRIAGTSIGSIIGALYASGMSGQQIRQWVAMLTTPDGDSWFGGLEDDIGRLWEFLDLKLGKGGLVDTGPFMDFLQKAMGVSRFDQLQIPLKVVAADFWERRQVVFEEGDLIPAIQASMAIPGLFTPVHYRGKVLVDGGLVNPVPYDLLVDECDVVIAIDVLGDRTPSSADGSPGYLETTFNTIQILETSLVREKFRNHPPDIYIHPELKNIQVLEFNRAEEIYAQAQPARDELMRALRWRIRA
jgi:NTE family protein